jgi:tellurite resistance protein TerC
MSPPLAVSIDDPLALAGLVALIAALLLADLRLFARGREPSIREGAVWSLGWFVLSLLVALPLAVLDSAHAAVTYSTVYLIERSLSLDNLFVFLLLFSYFAVPFQYRARLLFWGIVGALVLRALAILGGVALLERFEFLIYLLGAALLLLAIRVLRGIEEDVEPEANLFVRATRRFFPVTGEFHGRHWFVRVGGVRHATPLFLCLGAIAFADIVFAIDSIPAAFGITRDSGLIWMGNAFALLGLRALFVLVEGLIRRFRYLDETIAIVLALVAVKLLTEKLVHIGPLVSFGIVAVAFAVGILLSLAADRREGGQREAPPG